MGKDAKWEELPEPIVMPSPVTRFHKADGDVFAVLEDGRSVSLNDLFGPKSQAASN